MPWNEVSRMESRRMFISGIESERNNFLKLCEEFGISRKTGYKWYNRYQEFGEEGLIDKSRRRRNIKRTTLPEVEEMLIKERKEHPSWGARKLCRRISNKGMIPPPERTANRILNRAGLVEYAPKVNEATQRFERNVPNEMWQIDHKGTVHGRWSCRAVPFVVVDDHSRYLICLRTLPDKGLESTWLALWDVFGEFGMPASILSDNDMVFHGRNGPSQLETRLMRLGIAILHGRTYHPQTQGKIERLNGTLERDLLHNGSFKTVLELQHGFDKFRYDYNFERPHESLEMDVPGSRYRPSDKKRPSELPSMSYASGTIVRRVNKDGWISWKGRMFNVGRGLFGERVEIRETDAGIEIYYGRYRISGFNIEEGVGRLGNSTKYSNHDGMELRAP